VATLRATALFTVGRHERTVEVQPVKMSRIDELGACRGYGNEVHCWSPFRTTTRIASVDSEAYLPPYSPLPAELSLDPIQQYPVSRGVPEIQATQITIEVPVQHFFYDLELDHVNLDDAVTESRSGTP
jgi:hypothetical protein